MSLRPGDNPSSRQSATAADNEACCRSRRHSLSYLIAGSVSVTCY